jgi:pimeloyl-ACP methyl ester carboxylesterase
VGAPIRALTIGVVATVALLAGACETAEPAPAASREITFETQDGVALAGRSFGPDRGAAGVVLAHMFPADQRSWFAFAERLADRGYRVLTFNFRGYCPGGDGGCSEGEKRIPQVWQDVAAAVETLRAEGVPRIALVGASMGGTASLVAASREPEGIEAVVTLSAPTSFEGLEAGADTMAQVTAAKLFLAGHEDVGAAQALETLYAESLQPKSFRILTTGDHGTDILTGNQAGIAGTEILNWLERYVPVSGEVP